MKIKQKKTENNEKCTKKEEHDNNKIKLYGEINVNPSSTVFRACAHTFATKSLKIDCSDNSNRKILITRQDIFVFFLKSLTVFAHRRRDIT